MRRRIGKATEIWASGKTGKTISNYMKLAMAARINAHPLRLRPQMLQLLDNTFVWSLLAVRCKCSQYMSCKASPGIKLVDFYFIMYILSSACTGKQLHIQGCCGGEIQMAVAQRTTADTADRKSLRSDRAQVVRHKASDWLNHESQHTRGFDLPQRILRLKGNLDGAAIERLAFTSKIDRSRD